MQCSIQAKTDSAHMIWAASDSSSPNTHELVSENRRIILEKAWSGSHAT